MDSASKAAKVKGNADSRDVLPILLHFLLLTPHSSTNFLKINSLFSKKICCTIF